MRRMLRTIAWMLFAVAGCAVVFGWWVYSQRIQLDEQNRREIAHAGRDLTVVLDTVRDTVDKGLPRNKEEIEQSGRALPLKEFARRNPYVVWPGEDPVVTVNPEPSCQDSRPAFIGPDKIACPRFLLRGEVLQIETSPVANFSDIPVSNAFEYLLIADSQGKVRVQFEHGASSARRGQVGWIARQARERNDRSKDYPVVKLTDLGALISADAPEKAQHRLAAASGAMPIRVGEREFHLFYHPIRVAQLRMTGKNGCETEDTIWIVAGLADPNRMWREALVISPQWTLLLFLLLVVAISGQPWLKLVLITATERIRFADAALLVPSGALSIFIATALVVFATSQFYLGSLASSGLEHLAGKVEDQLAGELNLMREQLSWYDEAAWEAIQKLPPETRCSDLPDQEHLLAHLAAAEPGLARKTWPPQPLRKYRDFSQVAWVGNDGKQFLKGTVHNYSLRQDVSHRPYFLEPLAGRMWPFEGGPPVFVQSFRSFSTGGVFVAVALHSRLSQRCGAEGKPVVVVMSAEPLFSEDPLLPAGYGFAVITGDGQVVFHSDKRRMLKGDLYEEIGDPESLEAIILANASDRFVTTYLRGKYEMYVTPFRAIPQAGWYAVTFRDLQVLSTVNNEALVRTVVMGFIPLAIPLFAAAIAIFARRRSLALFWPAEAKALCYRELALIYGALLLICLLLLATVQSDRLLPFWLLFPAIPLLVSVVWYGFRYAGEESPGPPLSAARWYMMAGAGLWILMSVVPALGIYAYSWRLELGKLDRYENARAARHVRDWKAKDAERVRGLRIEDSDSFLEERPRNLNAYGAALVAGNSRLDFLGFIDRHLPIYNEPTVWLRHQHRAEAAPPAGTGRELRGYGAAALALRWPGLSGLTGVIAVGCFVLLLVRYSVRTLFLQELAPMAKLEDAVEVLGRHRKVLFLVRSDRERDGITALLRREWRGQAAAARAGAGTAAAVAEVNPNLPDLPDSVLVRDLEDALRQNTRLEELEEAWASGRRIVILSRLQPRDLLPLGTDTFVGERGDASAAPALSADVRVERWRTLLDRFTLRVAHVPGGADAAEAGQASGAYFGTLWHYCSREERLTLVQVAEEGLANPHQHETVRRLLDKGLLTLMPNLALMNAAFEHFVRRSAAALQVRRWEAPEAGLGWKGLRWIFLLLLLAGAAFVAGTQEALIETATAMIVALAGMMKAVQEIFGALSRRTSGAGGE